MENSIQKQITQNDSKHPAVRAVNQAQEEEVRDFLIQLLSQDELLFAKFRAFVSHEVTRADMQAYKKQVSGVVKKYLGRDRFISYQEASAFTDEMGAFLTGPVQDMLDDQNYMEAFELTSYVFMEAGGVDIDDSDGGLGMLMEQCAEIWNEILECADAQTERKIYRWITKHLDGEVTDYMEDYMEQALMDGFSGREYLEEKLAYTERKAQEEKQHADSWNARYHTQKWAMYHIRLMEEAGAAMQEILCYCKEHWECAQVREYYINRCMEQKDYDQAIAALKESLAMDAGMPGLTRQFGARLKEAYRVSGRQEEYRQQLWQLATKDNAGSLEDFRELKSLYAAKEWAQVREELFSALPAGAHVERFYQEEALYDRLLDFVLQARGLYAAQQYEEVLKEHYPQQLLQKYADELKEMAGLAADRRRYQEWASILRRMLQIEGGQEKVSEIVAEWRVLYKNRPAMMEELRQFDTGSRLK